jgi:hypothetical protein
MRRITMYLRNPKEGALSREALEDRVSWFYANYRVMWLYPGTEDATTHPCYDLFSQEMRQDVEVLSDFDLGLYYRAINSTVKEYGYEERFLSIVFGHIRGDAYKARRFRALITSVGSPGRYD